MSTRTELMKLALEIDRLSKVKTGGWSQYGGGNPSYRVNLDFDAVLDKMQEVIPNSLLQVSVSATPKPYVLVRVSASRPATKEELKQYEDALEKALPGWETDIGHGWVDAYYPRIPASLRL